MLRNMTLLVAILFICSLAGLGAARHVDYTVVASLKYEVIRQITFKDFKSVQFYGCQHVPSQFTELFKETDLQIKVMCTHADCLSRASDHYSKDGKKLYNVQFGCADAKALDISQDVFVLDSRACGRHLCSHPELLFYFDLVRRSPAKLFMVMDWWLMTLSVVDLSSGKISSYSESGSATKEAFQYIYDARMWEGGGDHGGGGSGDGSTFSYTVGVRKLLKDVLQKHNIQSMLDAPCGSFVWMPLVLADFKNLQYTGVDVACHVIQKHVLSHYTQRSWRFYCLDAAHQPLPRGRDLIFSRDALQHLPYSYIYAFLENVKRSGAKYWLVGSYPQGQNVDIRIGEYFAIDLRKAPFNVQGVKDVLAEDTVDNKHMLLIEVDKMTWTKPGEAASGAGRRLRGEGATTEVQPQWWL